MHIIEYYINKWKLENSFENINQLLVTQFYINKYWEKYKIYLTKNKKNKSYIMKNKTFNKDWGYREF